MPLSPEERLDLLNDPRWQSRSRAEVQALFRARAVGSDVAGSGRLAEASEHTPGIVKDTLSAVGGYAKEHPAEAGAIVGGLAAVPFTAGTSAFPAAMAAAGLGGFGGANLGMLTSAALDPNSPAPRTSMGVATEAGKQGAMQAGAEGAGRADRRRGARASRTRSRTPRSRKRLRMTSQRPPRR
jgi:hypothetical protein